MKGVLPRDAVRAHVAAVWRDLLTEDPKADLPSAIAKVAAEDLNDDVTETVIATICEGLTLPEQSPT